MGLTDAHWKDLLPYLLNMPQPDVSYFHSFDAERGILKYWLFDTMLDIYVLHFPRRYGTFYIDEMGMSISSSFFLDGISYELTDYDPRRNKPREPCVHAHSGLAWV